MRPRVSLTTALTLAILLCGVVVVQAMRDRVPAPPLPAGFDGMAPDLRSAAVLQRAVLSYDSLAADVYWLGVVQKFGRTKLSDDPDKRYDFLYPMLDVTTSLDKDFDVAYRFGAVFLAEQYPGGAGRPDLALALLEKGLKSHPTKWQYAYDIAFVHYWSRHDYTQAAEWFTRAARLPAAPNWLAPMAAVTLTQGGNRDAARRLWQQVFSNADAEWLMEQARFRLTQLDALDQIDTLSRLAKQYEQKSGNPPRSWSDLIRAGLLPGVPIDPRGFPYQLNPYWGTVTIDHQSSLNPLPTDQVPH